MFDFAWQLTGWLIGMMVVSAIVYELVKRDDDG